MSRPTTTRGRISGKASTSRRWTAHILCETAHYALRGEHQHNHREAECLPAEDPKSMDQQHQQMPKMKMQPDSLLAIQMLLSHRLPLHTRPQNLSWKWTELILRDHSVLETR
jgi:hypothetical protein